MLEPKLSIHITSASVYLRARTFEITSVLCDNVALHFFYNFLMPEWLGQASQGYEMYCHDLKVMGSNHGRVEIGVCGTSV